MSKKQKKILREEDKQDEWDEVKQELSLAIIKSNAFDNSNQTTAYLKNIYDSYTLWQNVKSRKFYRNYKALLNKENLHNLKEGARKDGMLFYDIYIFFIVSKFFFKLFYF